MEDTLNKIVLALSIVLQMTIIVILARRRMQRRLPWFFIYITYALIETLVRFIVAGNKKVYFNVYWLTSILGVMFSLMAVRESFVNVFRVYARYEWFTRLVWGCVGVAVLYSLFRAWAFPPVRAGRLATVIIDLELAVNYSLAFVGVVYFVLVRFQQIRQHQWESAVISGFATIGTLMSIATMTRAVFGTQLFSRWAGAVGYVLAEIEWAFVLSQPERETPKWVRDRKLSIDDLTRLDDYIRVLQRIVGRKR